MVEQRTFNAQDAGSSPASPQPNPHPERKSMSTTWKPGDLVAWSVNSRYGIACRVGTIKSMGRDKCLVAVKIRYFASDEKFVGRAEKAEVPREERSRTIAAMKERLRAPTERELKAMGRLA